MASKTAYLTIDDAPSDDFGEKIDYLAEQGIPAVIFCRGESVKSRPDLSVYAVQRGFILGNHSYSHPYFSDLDLDACFDQIMRTDALLNAVYQRAGVARAAKYFRFPFGDKGGLTYDDPFSGYEGEGLERKDRLQAFLRGMGYSKPKFPGITYQYYRAAGLDQDVDWYWTFDTVDYGLLMDEPPFGINSIEKIFDRMDEDDPEGGRGLNDPASEEIILMHDFAETTPAFFAMIDRLWEMGIKFKRIPAG